MASKKNIITVDGPAASGKSALSQALSKKTGWSWLSTGIFYRGLAFMALAKKQKEEKAIAHLIHKEDWSVRLQKTHTNFIYKGEDITDRVYTEEVDDFASTLARLPLVRKALLAYQRASFKPNKPGLVAEGRDCGTVVFPTAPLKIYLTADPELRAKRRARQRGSLPVMNVMALQKKRDEQDISRADSPLCQPEGAFIIDTGTLPFEEMVEKAYQQFLKIFND